MDADNLDQIVDGDSFSKCHRCGIDFQITGPPGVALFCGDCSALEPRLGISRMSSAIFVVVASLTVIFLISLLDMSIASNSYVPLSRLEQMTNPEEPSGNMTAVVSSSSSKLERSGVTITTPLVTPITRQTIREPGQLGTKEDPVRRNVTSTEPPIQSLHPPPSLNVINAEAGYKRYVVVSGDSLYAIAEQFLPPDFYLDEYTQLIREANSIEDSDDLSIGMELLIPQIRDANH
ncbi:MAG TPA: LysM peptidoglycan-binding domain-containing protein [Dehalococcoidia bacterium]|nr:LysM peptidoglycan-binding domain-containing protein [Dehalococcoidia bacterium]